MAAQYIDGGFTVYNMYVDYSGFSRVNSLEAPYGDSAFCYGFIIGG